MTVLFNNNATSVLAVDTAAGSGTITVPSGEGARFPAPTGGNYATVTLEDRRTGQLEICKVTARTGDVMTVTRAQEGTTAQNFAAGSTVSNRMTAATLAALQAASSDINFSLIGGVGDNSTDNAAALNAFGTAARALSAAGKAVTLRVAPGIYKFNHASCQGFLYNINRLRVVGYGAIFQNTYDPGISGGNFGYELPWGAAASPDLSNNRVVSGKLIHTTAIGDTTVTLNTIGDYANFSVGQWALVCSFDTQFYGYPPNPYQFDYVKITAINAGTGVITFADNPLRYEHRNDFPDGINSVQCGKARIFNLNIGFSDGSLITWDLDHLYEGVEIRKAPNSGLNYFSVGGRRHVFRDCILPGVSQSVAGYVEINGGRITLTSEPDKLVETCIFEGIEIYGGLMFQSASINRVTIRNCKIHGDFNNGCKYLYAENVEADHFGDGGTFGLNRSTTLINVRADMWFDIGWQGTPGNTIDGVNVLYANGVIRIPKSGGNVPNWGLVPGSTVFLFNSADQHSSDYGTGIVTSITEDATYIIIKTTLPFTSVPSWSSGKVYLQRAGTFSVINSSGGDRLRQASEATARGLPPWSYRHYTWAGVTPQNGYWGFWIGKPTRIKIDVMKATAISSANLQLVRYGVTKTDQTDAQNYYVTIDLTVRGLRDFTVAALTGKTTNDSVNVGGVDLTALPLDRYFDGNSFFWNLNYTPAGHTDDQLPVFDLQMEFDNGLYHSIIAARI